MRRLVAAVMICLLVLGGISFAEDPGLGIDALREEIRPGRPVVLSFTAPEDGACTIALTNGEESLVIAEGRAVTAGYNSLYWNGTCGGIAVPEGDWTLTVRMNGQTAETPVRIGRMIPCLISVRTETDRVQEGDTVLLAFYATEEGSLTLHVDDETEPLYWENIAAGEGEAGFQAEMEPGIHELILTLHGSFCVYGLPVSNVCGLFSYCCCRDGLICGDIGYGSGWFPPAGFSINNGVRQSLIHWNVAPFVSIQRIQIADCHSRWNGSSFLLFLGRSICSNVPFTEGVWRTICIFITFLMFRDNLS